MRYDALLRRLANRHATALEVEQASGDRIRGARRALVVLLSGRRVCGILNTQRITDEDLHDDGAQLTTFDK
jgi:hypothetical protein